MKPRFRMTPPGLFPSLMVATFTSGANAAPLSHNVEVNGWPNTAHRDAAVTAIQNVVNRHNIYGDFGGYNVYVYYNAGIPTAEASYEGSLGFGGTYPNDRVTQHELNHYLGSGTYWNWYNMFPSGYWSGTNVSKLIQQFDGDGARLWPAGYHFYPYGLNYDSEVTDNATYMRNVAIMYAMRQDMGIHTANPPWSTSTVTLTASDPWGTSAFNWFGGGYSGSYPGWSDNYFPHTGAAYSTGAFAIRTPQGYPGWTFGGDSLTVNAGGQLLFNGWGTDNAVTINNLILSGGTVRHDQNPQDLFQLAGNVSLTSTSTIEAANGPVIVLAPISGSGGLTTVGPYPTTLSATNTHSGGTTVSSGTLVLANGGGAGCVRGSLTIGSGARVELDAVDALGYDSGTSVTQINLNGGTLDNAVAGNNSARANWTLTGGNMTSTGGGSFHIGYQGANTITSNASATTSTISGYVVLRSGNSPTVTVADGAAATDLLISGAISQGDGPAGITKAGAGLLALGGANTYTGATTVNAGTLAFRTSPSNIGNVTVANGAGLQVQATGPSSTTLTSTALSVGTGGSTSLGFDFNFQNPSAPLVSTGAFTATGTVNLSFQNGSLLSAGNHTLVSYTSFGGGGSFPGSPFAVGARSTGTVTNNGVNALILNVTGGDRPVWTGLDNTNWQVGATGSNKNWKLQTAGTATDYIETDNVLFNDTPAGSTIGVNIAANVTPAATNFDTTKTYTFTSSGGFGIGGPGNFVKSGTGTVNLNTANTFTGSVIVDGGTLFVNPGNDPNNRAFSFVSDITVNSGTLKAGANGLFGWDGTQAKPITVHSGGTLTIDGTGNDVNVGTVTLNGGTLAGGPSVDWGSWNFGRAAGVNPGTGKLVATDNSLVTATNLFFNNGAFIDVASGKTLTVSGTITNGNSEGVCSLVKSGGTGTLVLSGTNTYSGGSTISAGTVSIADDAHIGANGSAITI
ncbi:MAG: autotransporter-associated beta strand repeat-containing protein, partial [Verrucomicrobiae bacterium]|nr:autotransporter-associated beta strand repeat-containing protein [Verrucomicrobiae bacterium]